MGGGSRIGQYERRFHEGGQEMEGEESEVFHVMKVFGEYEIREAESGGYELLKGDEIIGTFTEAEIEEDRVIFKLTYGTNLEVSKEGAREILSPAKAELCGLLASDGCVRWGRGGRQEGRDHNVQHYCGRDRETFRRGLPRRKHSVSQRARQPLREDRRVI